MASAAAAKKTTPGAFDFRKVARRLRESTSLSGPSSNGYANFGALSAIELGTVLGFKARLRDVADTAVFTVEQARNRLRELVDGAFKPKTLRELDRHLDARKLKVEVRAYGNGAAATYIVDGVTKGAVPAAQVHPSLSATALERRFGPQVMPPGMRPSERPAPPDPNVVRVRRLLHGIFSADKSVPPFGNWEHLQMSLPVLTDGLAYTVQGGRAYIGRQFAVASNDPAENIRIMQKALKDGVRLVLPADDRDDALAGRLVPGMAILAASDSVLARKVDPRLDHDFMAEAFGEGFADNLNGIRSRAEEREMFSSPESKVPGSNVIDFRNRFARRPEPNPVQAASAEPETPRMSVRTTHTMAGDEVLMAWDGAKGAEIGPAHRMAPGVYLKECAFEIPRGYVRVDEEGVVSHFSMDMRPHNPNGPAVVHPPGSGGSNEWALDGVMLSKAEFDDRTGGEPHLDAPPPVDRDDHAPVRNRAFA